MNFTCLSPFLTFTVVAIRPKQIWQTNFWQRCKSTSLKPWTTTLQVYPSRFQQLFNTNGLSCLMVQTFLKSLKQATSGLGIPHTSC